MANTENVFAELILGITAFTQEPLRWKRDYPLSLKHAMNAIALKMGDSFPKTMTAFIAKCHQPLVDWYPYTVTHFTKDYSLLDGEQLTEQASDYLYNLPSEVIERHQKHGFVPNSVLENWEMLRFLQAMSAMQNRAEAQILYTTIRTFLIEHSWITRKELNELKRQGVSEEVRDWLKATFYQQDDNNDDLYYCERCGILTQIDGHLSGIKPTFCDDHHPTLPHIHLVSVSSYARLKAGIHLRTFIPGQAELAVFNEAEALQDEYTGHLTEVIRYPGLDSYDLRIAFRDEVWAVDVKDIADPRELSRKIQPMDRGGDLDHDKAFYVVPNHRLKFIPDYLEQVRSHRKAIKPPLYLLGQEEFSARMRAKCAELVKASR